MTTETKTQTTVFQSGNSQAVRLPKAFRFNSKTVEIFRCGDEVVLRERKRSFADALDEATTGLAPMSDQEAGEFDAALKLAREMRPPQERDWAWLADTLAKPVERLKKPARSAAKRSPRR